MALENFCDRIIGIEEYGEITQTLAEFDRNLLQSRDEHGNSLLHLVVENDCNANVFRAVLIVSDLSVRNEHFKLAQDLFQDRHYEKEYVEEIVGFIGSKLRDADGDFIRDLITNGWDHVPYLKLAIDSVVDIMNDNFFEYLSSVEELIENVKMMTYEVINGDCRQLNLTENFQIGPVLATRNHYGLTMIHVATIFERFDLVNDILTKYEDCVLCHSDHMGRNILHYLYAMAPNDARNQLIHDLAANQCFNVVDILGNCPALYEYSPDALKIEACKVCIRTELLDVKNTIEEKSMQETVPNLEVDRNYLKKCVGKLLINALALLVEKRPVDPIEYLGCYLRFCESGVDVDKYEFESLSSSKMSQLCPDLVVRTFTFNPDVFSPFCKVARDKNGTPIGYKLLIKKLQSLGISEIDWFDIMKRGMNFGLRDSRGKTLIDLALDQELNDLRDCLDTILLNMINENNMAALRNLFSLGFFEFFPDIYELCGPDLFDVCKEMADFYVGLEKVNERVVKLFANEELESQGWENIIDCDMVAYVYNSNGVSLVHASIVANNVTMFKYLVENYPLSLRLKDCFNRNVAHYAVAYERDELNGIIDDVYPDAKTEMDCFDYLPEYYEFYKNEFRKLI